VCSNDLEKVRAYFRFITAQDPYSVRGEVKEGTTLWYFISGKNGSYTAIFEELCR